MGTVVPFISSCAWLKVAFCRVQGYAGDGSNQDILEDYVLSDDEDESAPAAEAGEEQARHRQSGKRAPAGKLSKGHKAAAASKGRSTAPSKGSIKSKATKSKHRQR